MLHDVCRRHYANGLLHLRSLGVRARSHCIKIVRFCIEGFRRIVCITVTLLFCSSGSRGARGCPPPPPVPAKKKKKEEEEEEKEKKIGPGIRQVRPPQHDVWGALECTAAPVSVHKDIHLDFEEVVTTYGHKHPRRMLLGRPLDAWFSSCWTSFFWSSWSSQWLQIFCKNCKYMYKLPCKFALWFFWNYTPK